MIDPDQANDPNRFIIPGAAPTSRTYTHRRCEGQTVVSDAHYTHISDPFRPCTATYCCTCANFVPLPEVFWSDSGEDLVAYRQRMRKETPGTLRFWRSGLGLLLGGAIGAGIGYLISLAVQIPLNKGIGFILAGLILGGMLTYLIGSLILTRIYDIDYRRMP